MEVEGRKPLKTNTLYESPVFDDLNTITGGFVGGGVTSSNRKRYCNRFMKVGIEWQNMPIVDIILKDADRVI